MESNREVEYLVIHLFVHVRCEGRLKARGEGKSIGL